MRGMRLSMKKGWIIGIVLFLLLVVSVIAGIYVYKQKEMSNDGSNFGNNELAWQEEYINNVQQENIVSTIATEEKISPQCILIKKTYYKQCDHLIREAEEMPEQDINKTKSEFEKAYTKHWKIEEFANAQIVISQEKEGFCGQHYKIKEHGNVIGIYSVDETGKETLKQDTEIQIMYLPEEDLEKIRKGIEVIGDANLYSTLEDYE